MPRTAKRNKYHTISINEAETLNLEQAKKLLVASRNSKIHVQIVLALLMGMRKSEINGLKYSDIDFIRRKLKIRHQLGYNIKLDEQTMEPVITSKEQISVKTPSSERELDIPDYVFNVLLEERKKYERNRSRRQHGVYVFQDLDYVCCSSYGLPRSKDYHFIYFKRLLEENNLPSIRFHSLRKTYATLLMKNNINQKAISLALGHSKSIITIDTYTETRAIIEDCTEYIDPFILDVHPFDEEDQKMMMEMFGEEVPIVIASTEATPDKPIIEEEITFTPCVHDYTDIEELDDIVQWHLGEEWDRI